MKKRIDEMLLKCCDWRGAEACKSDRSRQEFSSENLIATVGVDAAKNEHLKIRSNFKLRDLIFVPPPIEPWYIEKICT